MKKEALSSNASYQIKRGAAVLVPASEVTDLHLGRGLYREIFRDFEWLYISRVSHSDGVVVITYLELKTTQNKSAEGNSTTETVERRAVEEHVTLSEDDEYVLISLEPVSRPKGTRTTVVTTRTDEPLDD